jgi:hypothetical protein
MMNLSSRFHLNYPLSPPLSSASGRAIDDDIAG